MNLFQSQGPFDPTAGHTGRADTVRRVYDALFPSTPGSVDESTFTLEMLVDRVTGLGRAALAIGDFEVSKDYEFAVFLPDSGPTITAIGPSLAISNAPGQRASVLVRDLEIFTPVSEPGSWLLVFTGVLALACSRN